ncbi:hypothetical protein LIER_25041 [Lithospermum erythrorhizon]|uniref:Uncharacterized protein n=1 Tax=Lithospermum erythrorhizon TaxID=34254 RepID=A0AAV3R6K5_LITER
MAGKRNRRQSEEKEEDEREVLKKFGGINMSHLCKIENIVLRLEKEVEEAVKDVEVDHMIEKSRYFLEWKLTPDVVDVHGDVRLIHEKEGEVEVVQEMEKEVEVQVVHEKEKNVEVEVVKESEKEVEVEVVE